MSHVGRHIGRYRILEQLGSGGMSVVYKGLDTALDREVAVKVLHPHLAGKEESRKRLAREAKAVAKLHHPNILEVFDFAGAEADEAYIVTEYIRGQTLRQYASDQLFEPPEVAAMVIHEVAAALAHAHEAGIIHRDLKPENVMVREDGVLKLMDFGIAKIVDRDDRMTMTGALVGSPAHMAPEIIEGEEAGSEADVFSLGTMLYFFATGRLPFSGPNTTATLKKILDCVYDDPRQVMPTVSDDLAEIIATCLARQASARYPHAGKLRDALADYLAGLGLSRVTEELAQFFAAPNQYRKRLVPRLVESLLARGERFQAEKRPAKALGSLNQVLALQGDNARALALLQQMNVARAKARRKLTGIRAGAAAMVVAALVAGGAWAFQRLTRPLDYMPGGRPGGVMIPARVFPEPPPPPKPVEVKAPEVVAPKVAPAKPALSARKVPDEGKRVAKVDTPKVVKVPVVVILKPYGTVAFDSGETAVAEKNIQTLQVQPGHHTITVSCSKCEPVTSEIDVPSEGLADARALHVLPQPRPVTIVFKVSPPNAVVHLGKEPPRAVGDTVSSPLILHPARGELGIRNLEYQVTLAGYRTEYGTIDAAAGDTKTIDFSMERR